MTLTFKISLPPVWLGQTPSSNLLRHGLFLRVEMWCDSVGFRIMLAVLSIVID